MHSPLAPLTGKYGAKYSTYSGWEMPACYNLSGSEYQAAHSKAVLRDTSHWGRLLIGGKDHLEFLHRMSTNDFVNMEPGEGIEAVFPDNRGRILEAGTFYSSADHTLAILSPPGRKRLPDWLDRYIFSEEITVEDITKKSGMIELSGPHATKLAGEVMGLELNEIRTHNLAKQPREDGLWVARLDWFDYPGLRLIGAAEIITSLAENFFAKGASPLGEEAFEILRIEAGLPLFERELTADHNPWEAGLDRAIHLDKGCYIGQEVIARLDTYAKVKQHLVGLVLSGDSLPAPDTPLNIGSRVVGKITSATHSPLKGENIALAYVRNLHCAPGTQANFMLDGVEHKTEIVTLPFAF